MTKEKQTPKKINLPFTKEVIAELKPLDTLLLSGKMIVMRDSAHKKICELIERGKSLPIHLDGACIYYMAPCPSTDGRAVGSAGPTTSKRMDAYTPLLYAAGLLATIGKGGRASYVLEDISRHGGVYLCAVGGAGAYYSDKITEYKVIAYRELLGEAIAEITVVDFPVLVW